MSDILVDVNGDGIVDKDDVSGGLPNITDESGDGKLDVNLTQAESSAMIGGAIFQDAANVGSGTGNYNTILALQDDNEDDATTGNDSDGVETGFNAGQSGGGAQAQPEDDSNDEMDASKSEVILLGAIPIKIVDGIAYYEFRVDLNEANSGADTLISLDQFKLYVGPYDLDGDPPNPVPSTSGQNDPNVDLVDTVSELQTLDLVYDMDAGRDVSVLMDEANSSGSGNDDYVVLVPVSNFAGLDPVTTYVYLYVQMGAAGGDGDGDGAIGDKPSQNNVGDSQVWVVNGGFHEWNLQNAVIITGTKFNDIDGDGIKDAGEGGVEGVTIYIDDDLDGVVEATDNNGVLDLGEQSDITDADGTYSFGGIPVFDDSYTIYIREVVPAGSEPTTPLPVAVVIGSALPAGTIIDPGDVPGLLIGNHELTPSVAIDKTADVDGDCADVVGELITYTITVDNDGQLDLTNVVVQDDFEGAGNVTLTVTDDTNLNTLLDVGEVWLSGDDGDGILQTDETWTYSYVRAVTQEMIDGNGVDGTLDNTATVNADSATDSVNDSDDASVDVCQYPTLDIDKDADVDGDCADVVGELITYTVTLDNIGNVALENVVLEDDFEGGGNVTLTVTDDANANTILDVGEVWLSGDTGDDGIMGVDETWTYSYVRAVTQEDIDSDGYGNGTLDNTATANADAVTSGEAADEVTDDASVDVCQYPAITLVKDVKTDQTAGLYLAADDPDGPLASTSSTVDFRVTVTNTGNVSLENVTLSDTVDHNAVETDEVIDYNAINAQIDIDNDGIVDGNWSDYDEDGDGTLDDADGNFLTVDDFVLAPGASFAVFYSLDSALGQHENTAVVTADAATTGTDVTAEDDANYYVVESEDCVGVRTPGFWANAKWGQFWNLNANNPGTTATDQNSLPQAGQPGFASGELLYAIDTNEDGFVNAIAGDGINDGHTLDTNASGLLIGDYNMNGVTDDGEDTIFISLADAKALINASNKNIGDGKTADGIWMLGRDVVATWLNYLANNEESEGNCIGDVGGATNTPREYLDASIDWLQQFASDQNSSSANTNLNTSFHDGATQAKFQFDARIAPNSGAWQNPFTAGDEDIPVSAAAMHAALDGYNNTGKIGGIEYCCDADSEVALAVLSQINLV